MRDYKKYIAEAGMELGFPEEGTEALSEAWEKLTERTGLSEEKAEDAVTAFLSWIDKYDNCLLYTSPSPRDCS